MASQQSDQNTALQMLGEAVQHAEASLQNLDCGQTTADLQADLSAATHSQKDSHVGTGENDKAIPNSPETTGPTSAATKAESQNTHGLMRSITSKALLAQASIYVSQGDKHSAIQAVEKAMIYDNTAEKFLVELQKHQ